MTRNMLYYIGIAVALTLANIGCDNGSSSNSKRGTQQTQQNYCNPNYPQTCNNQNYNTNNGNCPVNTVNTQYGCLPTTNCPANYGFDQQSNQCFPAVQANGGYYQPNNQQSVNYYRDPYANSGAYPNYTGYNQNYYNPNQNYYSGY